MTERVTAMQEGIKQIAARIKEMREIAGVAPDALARDLGISAEIYRQYETGSADIPVGVLYKLAHRYGVELAALLTGEEPRLHAYCLTRKGRGVSVERRSDYRYQSLAYNFVHKKAEPFLVTVEPAAGDAPINYNNHPGQEFDYVIEGDLQILLDGYEITLHEGDALYFDAGLDHAMKALNGRQARFLAVIF